MEALPIIPRMDRIPVLDLPNPLRSRLEACGTYYTKYPVRKTKTSRTSRRCIRSQNPRSFKTVPDNPQRMRLYGSREDVFRGRAKITRGGLVKDELVCLDYGSGPRVHPAAYLGEGETPGKRRRDAKQAVPVL